MNYKYLSVALFIVALLLYIKLRSVEGFERILSKPNSTMAIIISNLPSQGFMKQGVSPSGYINYGRYLNSNGNRSTNLALYSTYEKLVKASLQGRLTPSMVASMAT